MISVYAPFHKCFAVFAVAMCALLLSACVKTTHEVRTYHEIQPIHIAVDVNLRIERELNDFFGDMDRRSSLMRFEDSGPASDS